MGGCSSTNTVQLHDPTAQTLPDPAPPQRPAAATMISGDDDIDLALALSMSLAQLRADEEQLSAAISLSLGQTVETNRVPTDQAHTPALTTQPGFFAGLRIIPSTESDARVQQGRDAFYSRDAPRPSLIYEPLTVQRRLTLPPGPPDWMPMASSRCHEPTPLASRYDERLARARQHNSHLKATMKASNERRHADAEAPAECVVCLEELDDGTQPLWTCSQCHNGLHAACFASWAKTHGAVGCCGKTAPCPLCRSQQRVEVACS